MSTVVRDYVLAMLAVPMDAEPAVGPRRWAEGLRAWLDQARRLDDEFRCVELSHQSGREWLLAWISRPLSATVAFHALTDGIDGPIAAPVECDLLVLLGRPDRWPPDAEQTLARRAFEAGYGDRCLVLEPRWAGAVLRGTEDGPLFWEVAARERQPSCLD
ncbi:hypothetical protein [Kutzneria sp. NPDC052558]|uniref:hypothetical protein n=1 Tax=Kutzneria sp. NPDC052558 TaxID=3364121 RepID=UPI0037C7282D